VICIDAGLAIRRVVFPEDEAVQKLWDSWEEGEQEVYAPSLLFYEVTNALYRYQRQELLSAKTVDIALEAALSLPVRLVSDPALHRRAKALAERYQLPATYDAHYLALAERLECELWTADRRMAQALAPFKLDRIRLIV
jgi:predicted nucleic acid-binding protein